MLNMHAIIGHYDIFFITLDTLRFDIAQQQHSALKVLSQYIKQWQCCHTPASFTYAAHHAFFTGFLPTPYDNPQAKRLFALEFAGSATTGEHTYVFQEENIIKGLEVLGYKTFCIGGVGFFNKQTALGSILPSFFQYSFWQKNFSVTEKHSTFYQIEKAIEILKNTKEKLLLFINISAIHQPNYFYINNNYNNRKDTKESHAAALRYVDSQLQPLFNNLKNKSFFIITSDHGSAYGEDGYYGHRLAHEVVWTVPYNHFRIE